MNYKKSVFFARLKRWMACLWPSGGRRQVLRLSLLKKQDLSSTPSRAKTVLMLSPLRKQGPCQKNLCALCGYTFNQKNKNYAKQTQFSKCQKCFNISKYKELQQIMRCGLLCKTNPIKPNFTDKL